MSKTSFQYLSLAAAVLLLSGGCLSTSNTLKTSQKDSTSQTEKTSLARKKEKHLSSPITGNSQPKGKERVISQEIDNRDSVKQVSGISKLFDKFRKPKRIPLPRTDLKSAVDDGTSDTLKEFEKRNDF